MAIAGQAVAVPGTRPLVPLAVRLASDPLWQSPLLPVALVATAGILLDSWLNVPFLFCASALLAFVGGWVAYLGTGNSRRAIAFLCLAVGALSAGYHHAWVNFRAVDDIGFVAGTDGHPAVLRGTIVSEPLIHYQDPQWSLRSFRRADPLHATLVVSSLRRGSEWLSSSGRVRLIASAYLTDEGYPDLPPDLHVGDTVEATGILSTPRGPGNPGEFDYEATLRDQRVSAILHVRKDPDAVVRLDRGWTGSVFGWLSVLHGWGQRQLKDSIADEKEAGLAMALLLGKGAELTRADWNKFIRTGVIHVLVISGQHVVVLSFILWKLLQLVGIRRRYAALGVAGVLLTYTLLVGAGLPVLRSAVVVAILCLGYFFRRATTPANSLAAAWLVIAAVNPTDIFNHGCQLSFLSVVVLTWGASRWFDRPSAKQGNDVTYAPAFLGRLAWLFRVRYSPDELQQLIDESRPIWQKIGLAAIRTIGRACLVTATVWIAVAPLVAAHYHTLAPVAILIAVPLAVLASIALAAGLLLLLCAAVVPPLVPPFAWITGNCMGLCEHIVDWAGRLPGSHWTTAQLPAWWLWGFYVALVAVLMLDSLRQYWRWFLLAGLGWLCLALALPAVHRPPDEMRCTFLSVGHGGCTVIETPDGRVLIYDVGAVAGPEVAQRQVVPYLLERGIRRIDEVFLSHADLDHFNGLLLLADDIPIGQVTHTPTFAEKDTAGVRYMVSMLEKRRIPVRIVQAGERLGAADVVIEVLHPPEQVPDSPTENENSRSMVLLVRHQGHTILLTGDLVGPGIARLLATNPDPVDVLMAPHHGSKQSNTLALNDRFHPQIVVSNQGPPPEGAALEATYFGAACFDTWHHGAIDVRSHKTGLIVETFRTGERLVVRKR